ADGTASNLVSQIKRASASVIGAPAPTRMLESRIGPGVPNLKELQQLPDVSQGLQTRDEVDHPFGPVAGDRHRCTGGAVAELAGEFVGAHGGGRTAASEVHLRDMPGAGASRNLDHGSRHA